MYSSFSTALSALGAYSTAVDVVGNNLANLSTNGYKTNTVSFFDVVSESLGGGLGGIQTGFGVGRPVSIRSFSQGAIQTSSGPMDAAIQGDGFLVVKDASGRPLYTRSGQLVIDKDGTLITPKGLKMQGWMANSSGTVNTGGPIGDIVIPVGAIQPPVVTTSFQLDMNLNAAAATGDTFSQPIEVFDSLGESHIVTVTFTKLAAANQWSYSISIPAADVTTAIPPVTGTLEFNSNGALINPTATAAAPAFNITGLRNNAANMSINWSIYSGTTPRITQFSQPSAVAVNSQNGSPAAQLMKVGMGDGGMVLAEYSDGRQIVVGQLAMASIRNPESLIAAGDSTFTISASSAEPAIGLPGTGGRGSIIGGALESSTVDMAREFTNLIVFQRGYQANSKVITTVDEMSQEALNLKR